MRLASFELTDLDTLQEMLSSNIGDVSGWDMRITQLQRGRFSGFYISSVLQGEQFRHVIPDKSEPAYLEQEPGLNIRNPRLYVAYHKYERQLNLGGCPPTDFFGFIIPLQEKPLIAYQGQFLDPEQIITITDPNVELDFVTLPGAEFLSVRIGRDRAAHLLSIMESTPQKFLTGSSRQDLRSLRLLKREFLHLLYGTPSLEDSWEPAADWSLEEELFEHLSLMIDDSRSAAPNRNEERCRTIAWRVRDYLEANLDRIVSIPQVCSICELSPRTLHYAFKSCFGVSPSRYHRYRRLHQVRAQLLQHHSAETTVTDLATMYNFFHFGRFAADYKAVFGETPAQTLVSRI